MVDIREWPEDGRIAHVGIRCCFEELNDGFPVVGTIGSEVAVFAAGPESEEE